MSEMEAGRELDALIAVRFFGWAESLLGEVKDKDNPFLQYGGVDDDGIPFLPMLPYYSTDIAAAWQVVEKLSHEWEYFSLCKGNGWGAEFWDVHEDLSETRTGIAHADTAPLAICRAALKAVQL